MDNMNVIVGNVCSLIAMGTDAASSAQKTAKGVLWYQILSQFVYCLGSILLKGYSAAVQNAVSTLRNLVAIKKVESKVIEWILAILAVGLGLYFNNLGWLGVLPVVANLQYTLAVFRFKDNERALKISFLICVLMFSVFNFAILNIVGFCSNVVVSITTAFFIIKKT